MPFEIRNEGDYFLVRLFGTVTEQDLLRLSAEADVVEGPLVTIPNRVVDFGGVEQFEIGYAQMHGFVALRKSKAFPNGFKSAVVVHRDVEFGFARMYQILNDHPQIEIRIVRSLQEALDWFAGAAART